MPKPVLWRSLKVLFVLAVLISAIVAVRPAARQNKDQVGIRCPGKRLLELYPAQPFAARDLPYALISCSGYAPIVSPIKGAARCLNVWGDLGKDKWTPWLDFPNARLLTDMNQVHLRAQIWEDKADGLLVVTFGGTEATNGKDWLSNTNWIHPFIKDEYSVLGRQFAPAFAKELARRAKEPGKEYLTSLKLVSTGHSLGAGLATKFAYSLPASENHIQKVSAVYAFDSSPVTTFLNTLRADREENKKGLLIYRIYERGEMLAILRAITAVVHTPPSANPQVTQRRYNLFGNDKYGLTDPIGSHSIDKLSSQLKDVAAGSMNVGVGDISASPCTVDR